jgi:hypothetical protein
MPVKRYLSDTWQGIVAIFVFVFIIAIGQIFIKFWQFSLAFIGVAIAIVLAMLFCVPKWIKVLGIIISASVILVIDGLQNFLILLLLIFIFNRIFHRN